MLSEGDKAGNVTKIRAGNGHFQLLGQIKKTMHRVKRGKGDLILFSDIHDRYKNPIIFITTRKGN